MMMNTKMYKMKQFCIFYILCHKLQTYPEKKPVESLNHFTMTKQILIGVTFAIYYTWKCCVWIPVLLRDRPGGDRKKIVNSLRFIALLNNLAV